MSVFFDMNLGLPSRLAFARIFSLIVTAEFKKFLSIWMIHFFNLVKYDMIHTDGKSHCGSACPSQNKKAAHIVYANLPKEQVTLLKFSFQITAMKLKRSPHFWTAYQLKRNHYHRCQCTHKGIANLIRLIQGHYVLALKLNHKRFYLHEERVFSSTDEIDIETSTR